MYFRYRDVNSVSIELNIVSFNFTIFTSAILDGVGQNGSQSGGFQCVYQSVQCPEYMECIWSNETDREVVSQFLGRHQSVVHELGTFI